MILWLQTLWQIALLRAGPQDLPTGNASMVLAIAMFSGVVVVSGVTDTGSTRMPDFVIAIVLPTIAAASILGFHGLGARFRQTVAALFGTGALISLINVPLWLSTQSPIPAPVVMLALVGLFWSLAVDGHIWRNALDCSYAGGLMTAVLILFLQLFAFQAMGNPGVC